MGQAANLAINPSLYAKMPFDALKDFTPIASVALQPVVLTVRRDSPFKNLQDFIKAAKARPGTYGIAQAGNGTVGHLADRKSTRLNSSHLVISYAVFCLKKKIFR